MTDAVIKQSGSTPSPGEMKALPFIDRSRLQRAIGMSAAADALEGALKQGLDPETQPDRSAVPVGQGEMLIMPASYGEYATVKLATVGGTPRIQGVAVLFDSQTLAPTALIDGMALTDLRTPAVSLLAARLMGCGPIDQLVMFGRGPQGAAHVEALRAEFEIGRVTTLHSQSGREEIERAIGEADVICCATTARQPIFDGTLVKDSALVIGVGSHEPTARELDGALVRDSAIVVESRRSALREAGDLVLAEVGGDEMTTLAELVHGKALPQSRPRLFKSTGMSWEDNIVAGLVLDAVRQQTK
jgi:ornithine cyclodeaminase